MTTNAENQWPRFPASSSLGAEPGDEWGTDKLFAVKYPLRILIADDNYINRRVLCLTLQRFGYTADSVENGADCLCSALRCSYHLILMDIHMPKMDGIECTRAIREAGQNMSIVAVTATSPQEARVECLAAGMNGYMEKPVNPIELKNALRVAYLRTVFTLA